MSSTEARVLLEQHGPNELEREPSVTRAALLFAQFKSPLVLLLLVACAVSVLLGESKGALAIAAIVAINACIGFLQEYRAERAVRALRAMTSPRARVLRDGRSCELAASAIVPGDCLLLEAGDVVAADATLVEQNALLTNEAALTGESLPVEKAVEPVAQAAPLAERHDSVFMGTAVVNGNARALVRATGMNTELGKIARLLATAHEDATPLKRRLAQTGRVLVAACLAIVAVVAVLGLARGRPLFEVLISAVSLAVAAVPEGLPVIVTIALAIGVQRMARRNVLVRKLEAVETLGCASVVCSDKTGTLTTGVMSLREIWGPDHARVIFVAAACCNAELDATRTAGIGDPTEVALLVAAAERGIDRERIERDRPRVRELAFDSRRKRMSIERADGLTYVKGAVESVLSLCVAGSAGAVRANAELSARGLRVLAIAIGRSAGETELELVGLVGLADPPRPEALLAVAAARAAGIRVVMITGDHPDTARAIANELGILTPGEPAAEVVHARATPEDKLAIVREWKRRGAVVAMTGDGVNDAPALREAQIGIAMGKTGTEVAREASDMILVDDNFASIVAAIHEGRGVFDNIQKTLVYLLAGNAGELIVMLGAALAALPVPLLPLHLLWINLVTDGLPGLALVMDPADPDAMKRPPRAETEPMVGRREWAMIGFTAVVEAGVVLAVFALTLARSGLAQARSLAFSVLVLAELFRALASRSRTRLFVEFGPFNNPRLLLVIGIEVLVQLAIYAFAPTRALFQLRPLSWALAALALGLGLVPVSVLELMKLARRAKIPRGGRV